MLEWDDKKSRANLKERGFGFDLAEEFDFEKAYIAEDTREDYGERRFRAWGRIDGTPYMVAFTPRGKNIRIISMRRMHENEAKRYNV